MNICISREFGSGGHDIGEQIAMQTGYRFLDRKLVEEAAERSGIAVEHLEKEDEKKANPWLHNVWYKSEDESLRGLSANDILFRVQSRYILECARKGDNVFVGRCADYVLKKAEIPHISIFITAPYEDRVFRIMERRHLCEKDAQTLVRKTDKRRKAYYNYYTEGGWGKPDNYDLCINSSRKGIRKTADILRTFLEEGDSEDGRKEI